MYRHVFGRNYELWYPGGRGASLLESPDILMTGHLSYSRFTPPNNMLE